MHEAFFYAILFLLRVAGWAGSEDLLLLPSSAHVQHSAATAHPVEGTTYYIDPAGEHPTLASLPVLQSGDVVLLRAGGAHEGHGFDPENLQGPVRFGRYGEGPDPVITSTLGFYNVGGVTVEDLHLRGGSGQGLGFYTDVQGRLPGIVVRRVRVEGWTETGLSIGSWAGDAGYDGILIEDTSSADNGGDGISVYAEHLFKPDLYFTPHRNLLIRRSVAERNRGIPGRNSGFGIIVFGVADGLIEDSEAHRNGATGGRSDAGPFGMMIWASRDVTIRRAYASHNRSATIDGGGLDIDGDCIRCTIEDSRTHDNQGPGYFLAAFKGSGAFQGNIIRNNISENDGQKNNPRACISVWRESPLPTWRDNRIEGNTCTVSGDSHSRAATLNIRSETQELTVRNNTFRAEGRRRLLDVQDSLQIGLVLDGNHYISSGVYRYRWGDAEYASLAEFTAATGHERSGREGDALAHPPPPPGDEVAPPLPAEPAPPPTGSDPPPPPPVVLVLSSDDPPAPLRKVAAVPVTPVALDQRRGASGRNVRQPRAAARMEADPDVLERPPGRAGARAAGGARRQPGMVTEWDSVGYAEVVAL